MKDGHRHHHVAHLRRPASETAVSVGVAVGVALRARPVPWSDVSAAAAASNARRPRMVAPETHHLAGVTVAHAPWTRPITWMKWMKGVLGRGGGGGKMRGGEREGVMKENNAGQSLSSSSSLPHHHHCIINVKVDFLRAEYFCIFEIHSFSSLGVGQGVGHRPRRRGGQSLSSFHNLPGRCFDGPAVLIVCAIIADAPGR